MKQQETSITTLHQAFDAYSQFIERRLDFEHATWVKHRLLIVGRLRDEHSDESLAELNLDRCAQLIDHWKNRPFGKNGNRLSRRTCVNFLSELVRFLRWLDMSRDSSFEMPRGIEHLNRRVVYLPPDRREQQRRKVTVYELHVLFQQAEKIERLMICLALNCGLRPADMGRLTAKNVAFVDVTADKPHLPDGSAILQIDDTVTDLHREYVLWPETLELLRWAIERADKLGQHKLFVTDSGKSMLDTASRNSSAAMTIRFKRLVNRVRKVDPEFPSLNLTSIRLLGYELVCSIAGFEVGSLFLGHAPALPASAKFYVARPFARLHSALLDIRNQVEAIFEITTDRTQHPPRPM